jgi:mRNA interferase RelE/StbE
LAYNVTYKSSVQKDLKRLPKSELTKILDQIEATLPNKAASYAQLKGEFKGLRKLRVGDYRVIYAIKEKDVIVLKIGHRKDVYR